MLASQIAQSLTQSLKRAIWYTGHMNTQPKNTICLWYQKDAQAAAEFYAATFPDSKVGAVFLAPSARVRRFALF